MPEQDMRMVTPLEAARLFERLPAGPWPSTLHPAYALADARRDAALEPSFFCFESQGETWMHALHVTRVTGTRWRDASSPYGYGGPLSTSADASFRQLAWGAYAAFMRERGIVVEYVRFHPLLGNERWYGGRVLDNRQVVTVDLEAGDPSAGYASRLRQVVKKAAKLELRYEERPLAATAREFGDFHRAAMEEMGADPFFSFPDDYFESLGQVPGAVVGICTGPGGSEWLAASLFLDGRGVREYHLAATSAKGRAAGASSFTLHRAALEAQARGIARLYLGGGTDARPDNPLFFFKSGFSPQRLTYRTGSAVFDAAAYEELKSVFPEQWQAHPERPIFYRKV